MTDAEIAVALARHRELVAARNSALELAACLCDAMAARLTAQQGLVGSLCAASVAVVAQQIRDEKERG
jgi:hypothetical protein